MLIERSITMQKKLFSLLLVLSLFFTVVLCSSSVITAQVAVTSTVNVATARQNLHGHGYEWDNRNSILTLTDCLIDTADDFGLKLPADCTVILEGNNTVKAGKYGISCSGNVIFKGKGTLTVEAPVTGIYLISQDSTTRVRVLSGDYTVKAGKYGLYSEYTEFSLSDGSFTIEMTDPDSCAVLGKVVNLVGGDFTANASVKATQTLLVDSVNLSVDAGESALVGKTLYVRNEAIDGSDEYSGETSIHAKAVTRWHATSILFGENVGGWVDYAVLAAVLLAVAACVVIPKAVREKKKRELYARLVKEGYMTEAEANEKMK